MLTRQEIISTLQHRGFRPTNRDAWVFGAIRVTVLDAPRVAVASPLGLTYIAFGSKPELEEQLTSLVEQQTAAS